MATNPLHREYMEMDDGEGAEEEGAESSYGLTFTAEDAAVRGDRDVVLPSNILSAIAGASPSAAPGYGLLWSTNPALDVDPARDAVIPGPNSVDVTQEYLVVEDPLDQDPADEMEKEDDTVACLEMVGVIPFILDVFKPRCSLHIKYRTGDELRNGDILLLREICDERPSVAVRQKEADILLPRNLFTVVMVELEEGQYLNWAVVNLSDQSGLHQGLEMVDYEPPSRRLTHGRHPYMFVCYSQFQPFTMMPTIGRQKFDLRSFCSMMLLTSVLLLTSPTSPLALGFTSYLVLLHASLLSCLYVQRILRRCGAILARRHGKPGNLCHNASYWETWNMDLACGKTRSSVNIG